MKTNSKPHLSKLNPRRFSPKKRRLLLIGLLAVILPLCLMMGLQYWWLVRLKTTSSIARTSTQEQFLSLLSQKVDFFYGRLAEQMLQVPAVLVTGNRATLSEELAKRFKTASTSNYGKEWREESEGSETDVAPVLATGTSMPMGGTADTADTDDSPVPMADNSGNNPIQPESAYKNNDGWDTKKKMNWENIKPALITLFATSFQGEYADNFLFQGVSSGVGTAKLANEDLDQTIRWACEYWRMRASSKASVSLNEFVVDQRDARYPMIINPIGNDQGELVGVLGFVVNPEFFSDELLPRRISALESVLNGQKDWRVQVFESNGQLVLSKGAGSFDKGNHTLNKTSRLPFIFSNWTVTLSSHPSRLEQLAGTNFWLNITLSAVLALALIAGIVSTFRTAAHEMELSDMKSDFVSNVSHELRTPLASIRVFGELLRLGRTTSPEKVKEYGTYIENEGRRLTRLINNILDFSKIESNQKIYHFEQADLEAVLLDVIATFRVRLQGEGIAINYVPPKEALPLMSLDSDALTQVFFNLLDNGIKYGNDSNHLDIRLSQQNGMAVLSFQDHGMGIAKEESVKIFERFHRVDTGLVHDVKGSGLGLAIVRHVAEAHWGKVSVSSQLGKGSTFSLYLPLSGPPCGEQV